MSSISLKVETKNLEKFLDALQKVADPNIKRTHHEETGVFTFKGISTLHLEDWFDTLKHFSTDFEELPRVVSLKEIVREKSPKIEKKEEGFSLVIDCQPLLTDFNKLEEKSSSFYSLVEGITKEQEDFISKNLIVEGTNCLLNYSKSNTQELTEIFKSVVGHGGLCGEELHATLFTVYEFETKEKDYLKLGKEAFYSCQYSSSPTLIEPIMKLIVTIPKDKYSLTLDSLYYFDFNIVGSRESVIHKEITCQLPELKVQKGFTNYLRKVTSRTVQLKDSFDSWKEIAGDPFTNDSECNKIIQKYRTLKNIDKEIKK